MYTRCHRTKEDYINYNFIIDMMRAGGKLSKEIWLKNNKEKLEEEWSKILKEREHAKN